MSANDREDIVASFRLTDEEARVANGDIRNRGGGANWQRITCWVVAVIIIVYGFVDPLLWQTGVIPWKLELQGLGFAILAAALTWGSGSVKPGVDTVIRFSEAGLFCERPLPLGVPWKVVRGAFDDGDSIRITLRENLRHPIARHFVIPKRIFADEGMALWELLEASLIGKRMLISRSFVAPKRRPDVRAIMNTRS